jgi:hypothetical protein
MKCPIFLLPAILAFLLPFGLAGQERANPYLSWKHSGSLTILTTPEGANLPAGAAVDGFPLLVRLHKDWFDFSQVKANGDDIRFSDDKGSALAFHIEEWDAVGGTASIWVRIPRIEGNARQFIHLHWGKAEAVTESNAKNVFNETNGYVGVWHMGEQVQEESGSLASKDEGTTVTEGMIGKARHLAGKQGVFCGDKNTGFPSGSNSHSSQAWFRSEKANGKIVAWGNEEAQGKVVMQFASPPHIRLDCYFSGGNVASEGLIPMNEWTHVVHTYEKGDSRVYVNGVLCGTNQDKGTPLNIKSPSRMWIGGWYNNYDFVGAIDEVRISQVVRNGDWVKLEFENQKAMQTVVGPLIQAGDEFSVSEKNLTITEGDSLSLSAKAGGAQKLYWSVVRGDQETILAVDRFHLDFAPGRVSNDQSILIRFRAVYPGEVKSVEIPVNVKEAIPDPVFTLQSVTEWDGRQPIEVVPQIANSDAMKEKGSGDLSYQWHVTGLATIKEETPGKLLLHRAQNSGELTITLTLSNGGSAISSSATIAVKEPAQDAWVERVPDKEEKPMEGQFYARDDKNEGTLFYQGTLPEAADSVFLKVFADDKPFANETQKPGADQSYAFRVRLKPGLIKYRVEFGTKIGDTETVVDKVGNLVCGDAYVIDGQSNALATDTGEESPRDTNEWIRSYGDSRHFREGESENLWCNPVWKAQKDHKAELGWWGMELAKGLLASQKVPICIINGAVGGTRIDQHQRNSVNPEDLSTIYGRLLWRVRQARLTHGIRAVLWHQGESDQGTDGPDGGYGWQTYQRYFIDMSAAWKQDFPNIKRYYIYQIWPNSCSMGNGNGDMLREIQRTLPRLYSNMDVISTLGIQPAGPCHFPLIGWTQFAHFVQPLIERDFHGRVITDPVTSPNLVGASFSNKEKTGVVLEFDQPVVWNESLFNEFYFDGVNEKIASGAASGNTLVLTLKEASTASAITYLKEKNWSQDRLLFGKNGLAALTFCHVPLLPGKTAP